jgi:hypothetical protein
MFVKASYRGGSMVKPPEKKIHGLTGNLTGLLKSEDSYFWVGLMAIKKYFFHFRSFLTKDGSRIHFCEDSWLVNAPFGINI